MRYTTILILLLSEGLPGVVFGETHRVTEGQDITVKCDFIFGGSRRIFCKNDCGNKRDILVETTENRAVKDRYSIQFKERTNTMTVGIKKVQLSDSGQYKCWMDRTLFPDSEEKFKIHVTKAPSPVKPPAPPLPPVIPRTTAVRPTHSPDPSPDPDPDPSPDPDPDPGLDSGTSIRPEHEQTVTPHGSPTGSLLYPVGVTLAVILTLFSVALLLFYCKRKIINPKAFPRNAEFEEVPEGDREYEEILEQQVQSRSDNLASAPAHMEVDSVLYSEVEHSRNSAPHSQAEAVIYSTVSAPLYSTVSAPQQK